MAKLSRVILFLIMIPAFAYSFFATSWTGSYIMLEEDWMTHTVLTPKSATGPEQIYEVDKFLYAFTIQPFLGIVCLFSFFILIGILIYWVLKKFRFQKAING